MRAVKSVPVIILSLFVLAGPVGSAHAAGIVRGTIKCEVDPNEGCIWITRKGKLEKVFIGGGCKIFLDGRPERLEILKEGQEVSIICGDEEQFVAHKINAESQRVAEEKATSEKRNEGVIVNKSEKAIVLFARGQVIPGQIAYLNSKEVRFARVGQRAYIPYRAKYVRIVQTPSDIYIYNIQKKGYESANALGVIPSIVTRTNGRRSICLSREENNGDLFVAANVSDQIYQPHIIQSYDWTCFLTYEGTRVNSHGLKQNESTKKYTQGQKQVESFFPSNSRGQTIVSDADVQRAICKILIAWGADSFSKSEEKEEGFLAKILSKAAQEGRDELIESALKDVFPDADEMAIRAIRRVASLYLDDKLTIGDLTKETAKEELIEVLKKEDPRMGFAAKAADFLYSLKNEAKSKQ